MMGDQFTKAQMEQFRSAVREELADAGLRIDGPEHVDDAREDFRFLRKLRKGIDGTSSKVGMAIIAAIVGVIIWLVNSGLTFWKGH
jgi:hypothetical protein